jgi:hypothetical protein
VALAFKHILVGPLQFSQAESTNIQIIGLENAVDTGNQFLPSQYKGLLSVILFRTTLFIKGYDGGPHTGFNNSSMELPQLYLYNRVRCKKLVLLSVKK